MKRKVVSILLTAVLLISVLPLSAFAATPVVTLDTPLTLIPGAGTAEATFTPTETGIYEFRSESVDPLNQSSPILTLFDGEDEVDWLTGDNYWDMNNFFFAYCLTAGKTYTLSVTDDMVSTAGAKITVNKAVAKTLAMNTPLTVTPGDGFDYAIFTPAKDGEYSFFSAGESSTDPYLRGIDNGGDVKMSIISGNEDDYDGFQFRIAYKLRAGYTYTLAFDDYNNVTEGFTVTATEYHELLTQPTAGVPTVKVTTPDKATFQWHQVDRVTAPVTDTSAAVYGANIYDNGQWIGEDRGDWYWLMDIDLKNEEVLTVKSADKIVLDRCAGYGYAAGIDCDVKLLDENTVQFHAHEEMPYSIMVATAGTDDHFTVTHGALKLGAKIDGQTADTLTKFEKNKYYACVITYPDGTTFTSQFFKMEPAVAKQPTVSDPSVKVNFADEVKGHQWYEMNIKKTTPVTEDNVKDIYGQYDEETGEWTGPAFSIDTEKYAHELFTISLSKGQSVIIETSDTVFAEYSSLNGLNDGRGTVTQAGDNMVVLTAGEADDYAPWLITNGAETAFKVWIGSMTLGNAISGQTTDTLTAYEKNKAYVAKVTYEDGVQLTSDIVMMNAMIVKQPTASDPTVKVNFESDVISYQWYTYEQVKITDQNAKAYEYGGKKATFDSETGIWTGVEDHWGYGDHGYFVIDLKKDDEVLLDLNADLKDYAGIEDMADKDHLLDVESLGVVHQYRAKADKDGSYYLYVSSADVAQVKVEATLKKVVPIAGEVKPELQKAEAGRSYFCRITYKDGDTLVSDTIQADKATGIALEVAAADETDKAAQQALLDRVNELLKDKNLTEQEKKVLGALKLKLEQNIAAIEQAEAQKKPAGGSPNTGVVDMAWLWLALLVISGSGVAATLLLSKKKPTA